MVVGAGRPAQERNILLAPDEATAILSHNNAGPYGTGGGGMLHPRRRCETHVQYT